MLVSVIGFWRKEKDGRLDLWLKNKGLLILVRSVGAVAVVLAIIGWL
jgi:hypothetical protein